MVGNTKTRGAVRIGIYAGAFDPVHAGHVAFALQALAAGRLDEVIFLPERRPRFKPGVEHYAHRIAMIKAALAPHPALAVLEMVDRHYTVHRTLPQLRALFPDAELAFLMGSDTALTLPSWPYAERILTDCELIVGVRTDRDIQGVEATMRSWNMQKPATVIRSYAPSVSSSAIRQAVRSDRHASGLLTSVGRYIKREWLYVSPAAMVAENFPSQ